MSLYERGTEQDMNRFLALLSAFEKAISFDELAICSKSLFGDVCQTTAQRRHSRNVDLQRQIEKYILEGYANPNLSLQLIASEFDMSEKYLSNFFKEQSGENISTYIEQVRIKRAMELLNHGVSVDKTSGLVGYNSANTFYRAFKRATGSAPSAYRDETAKR